MVPLTGKSQFSLIAILSFHSDHLFPVFGLTLLPKCSISEASAWISMTWNCCCPATWCFGIASVHFELKHEAWHILHLFQPYLYHYKSVGPDKNWQNNIHLSRCLSCWHKTLLQHNSGSCRIFAVTLLWLGRIRPINAQSEESAGAMQILNEQTQNTKNAKWEMPVWIFRSGLVEIVHKQPWN